MPTFKTWRIGHNYVTADVEVELPPLAWDEMWDVTAEEAAAIRSGAMPDEAAQALIDSPPDFPPDEPPPEDPPAPEA